MSTNPSDYAYDVDDGYDGDDDAGDLYSRIVMAAIAAGVVGMVEPDPVVGFAG
jgi:hypothetical protein